MAQSGTLEKEIEIKAPAAKFYNLFRKKIHRIPSISKERVHGAKVYEGDWENVGSVKHWDYTIEGKKTSAKIKIEAIDDDKKSITYNLFDGEISENYESLKATLQVTDRENGGLVKWTYEYEKLRENITVASPESCLDLAIKVSEDIDAHLTQGIASEG